MSSYSKIAAFAGGVLFGSVGLKVLSSREAKKAYVYAAAAGLRAKDCAMETVTKFEESANDILASAKELNEEYDAKAKAKEEESMIFDESEESCEAKEEPEA